MPRPSAEAGPSSTAACPNVIVSAVTPFSARAGGGQGRDRNGCGERAAQHQMHGIPQAFGDGSPPPEDARSQ